MILTKMIRKIVAIVAFVTETIQIILLQRYSRTSHNNLRTIYIYIVITTEQIIKNLVTEVITLERITEKVNNYLKPEIVNKHSYW